MKTLWFLPFLVGTTLAGVVQLSADEEEQKLEEFSRLCLGGNVGENGVNIDGVQVYCKMSTSPAQEFTSVHSTARMIQGGPSQAVYVRPPPLKLVHRVNVAAEIVNGKTNVLVVPPEVDNQYQIDISPQTQVKKPAISYLSAKGRTESSGGYSYNDASASLTNEGILPLSVNLDEETATPEMEAMQKMQVPETTTTTTTTTTTPKPRQERKVLAFITPTAPAPQVQQLPQVPQFNPSSFQQYYTQPNIQRAVTQTQNIRYY